MTSGPPSEPGERGQVDQGRPVPRASHEQPDRQSPPGPAEPDGPDDVAHTYVPL